MNKQYAKGVRWEREVKKDYESNGFMVVRASGSHSPFDLVAVKYGAPVHLVQCKVTKDTTLAARITLAFAKKPPMKPNLPIYTQIMKVKILGQPKNGHIGIA